MTHGFGDRDEMKDHAEIGGMEGEPVQKFFGAGEGDEYVEKSQAIKRERHPEPDDCHIEVGRQNPPVSAIIEVLWAAETLRAYKIKRLTAEAAGVSQRSQRDDFLS